MRRLVPALATTAIVIAGLVALAQRPAVESPRHIADHVIVVGVPGLHWQDIDPDDTPALWGLAERGAIGSLSVRSARRPTCPVDGWLTLGAGNYAAWDVRDGEAAAGCGSLDVVIEEPDGIGANLPEQQATVAYNRERLPWGAIPGALAESVRCTVAVGPGAAVAAARPFGRVDRYEPALPEDPADLLSSCALSVVDAGVVAGEDPADRAATARRADRVVARVLAARPQNSLVLVAGLADTGHQSRLRVVIADGPGWTGGRLTSPSTGRDGYVQLVDLAPTALAALDRPMPEHLLAGQAALVTPGRPQDLGEAIAAAVDADGAARAQRRVSGWFFGLLTVTEILLAVAAVPLLRRARSQDSSAARRLPRRVFTVTEILLVAAALTIPAALLVNAVPWWRSDHPGLLFGGLTALLVALVTVVVRITPLYRRPLGPMAVIAGFAALVVGLDLMAGARLQLNGVAGYSTITGARYAGLGAVGLGVLIAGLLPAAGCLVQQRVPVAWRSTAMVLAGVVGVVLAGSPYLGGNPVGAVALTAGVTVAAAIGGGGWLTFSRLTAATLVGLLFTAGFAVLDVLHPPAERSGLGRFLADLAEGSAGLAVHRAGVSNIASLVGSPLSALAVASAVLVWFALLRPWGGLLRLFGLYPVVRAGMAGVVVASVIAGLLGGTALIVAGAAAAVVVPLTVLAALRVLARADQRTFAGRPASPPAIG